MYSCTMCLLSVNTVTICKYNETILAHLTKTMSYEHTKI